MIPSINNEIIRKSPHLLDSNCFTSHLCLLCDNHVTGTQRIWSCGLCYSIIHLKCIQSWVRQSCNVFQFGNRWNCPQCKGEYNELPTVYKCFCGQVRNPPSDPWLLPHSCGNICNRIQDCGHLCIIICHGGSCPPCAKTVDLSCYCGQGFQIRRCGKGQWSCGKQCFSMKKCGQHSCLDICHPGPCRTCSIIQTPIKCLCGKNQEIMECGKYTWKCDLICGMILSCGNHRCEQFCHPVDECLPCPRTFSRNCPCGRTKYTLPCLEDAPRCENICDLFLTCNVHKCTELCHFGPCPPCKQVIRKFCSCRKIIKPALCEDNVSCDSKCNKILNCSKHSCKIKCCNGKCLPCKETCKRKLSCNLHCCNLPCHSGPCFPCLQMSSLLCACGSTQEFHRCGIIHLVDHPKCLLICKIISDCHHRNIQPHQCHFGDCPPCTLVCNRPLENCYHICSAICHSKPVLIFEFKYVHDGPWKRENYTQSRISHPCPPCSQIVSNFCIGGHIVKEQKCSDFVPFHCDKDCSRILDCGKHKCDRSCHKVSDIMEDTPDYDCVQCTLQCNQVRPPGCMHKCILTCHSYPCPPCNSVIKFFCHCRSLELSYICNYYTSLSVKMLNLEKSCRGKCAKKMSCGHSCAKVCHLGDCNSHVDCKARVTLRCPCGKILISVPCKDSTTIRCDDSCLKCPVDGVFLTSEETHFPAKRKTKIKNTFYFHNTSINKRIKQKQNLLQTIMRKSHPVGGILKTLALIIFLFILSNIFLNH